MFPSWRINDKYSKWNETSVDFIFYSEAENKFLCIELKNKIKNRKELLSAYCQTTDRTLKFVKEFSVEKIEKARIECLKFAKIERGGNIETETIKFRDNPQTERVLLAHTFPEDYQKVIENWNQLKQNEIFSLIDKYTANNELKRFKKIDKTEWEQYIQSELIADTIKNLL
ncbi:MAG: hypothetical protein K1X92_13940 [Bacteroidia bacterium]|nr:hypothetical protein [Bacteroidia bacterium]